MTNIPPMLVLVLLPLIAGFILLFVPNRMRLLGKAVASIISVISLYLAIGIYIWPAEHYSASLLKIDSFELNLVLAFTQLGSILLIAACIFGLLIILYSFKSLGPDFKRVNEYYGAILLTIGGSAGILLSQQLLPLLIFWEIVTASLYILITTGGKNTNFAATKSFAMIGLSDGALLLGIAMVWVISGSFKVSQHLPTDSALSIIAFLLLLTAAITKAGAMPLHTWVPTSGEFAPVSVMALLPAAIDKLLGIYLLVMIVRQVFIISSVSLSMVMAIIGAATIIVAVMIAMVQHNLKKLLSYHAISQVGYMILGIATGTPVGIAGGVFHMLNNAIYKGCLFLCGGAVEQQCGTAELEKLGGLGKKMPITFAACTIAALSISGIPPLNGFVSKWMVYQGVIQMGTEQSGSVATLWPIWLTCAMFGSALTLASFVKLLHSLFLSRMPSNLKDIKEVSPLQTVPMVILAAACVFLGVFYYLANGLIYPALGFEAGEGISGTWQSILATALIIIGVVIGFVIWLIGKGKIQAREVPTWYCGEKIDNDRMIIPGTHFYKTVTNMNGLKQLYSGQEKRWFDTYDLGSKLGLGVTEFLRWIHNGFLPRYLTWVTLGLLVILFVVCRIW